MGKKAKLKKSLSVLKRTRQNKKRQLRNKSAKSRIKTLSKSLEDAINANNRDLTHKLVVETTRALHKASSKGILHKNTSSRKVSSLTRKANSIVLKSESV